MSRTNIYLQKDHSAIVDGVPLNGFAEGDWLTVDIEGNAATRTLGGDGPSMNIGVPEGGVINISLVPTSPTLGTLTALYQAQKTNPRLFTVALLTGTREVVIASGCAFGKLPQFGSGGPTQQPRQFEIQCLEIKLDESLVETILGGIAGGLV